MAVVRIAILTAHSSSDYTGGVEVFNDQLAASLPAAEVLAYPSSTDREGHVNALGAIGLHHPRRAWWVARRFFREHQDRPFDLAITNGLYGWPLTFLPPDIPLIQVYHFTMAGLASKAIQRPGVRFLAAQVEGRFDCWSGKGKHVVAVSRNVLNEVNEFYRLSGRVIPNGVDVDAFRPLNREDCRERLGIRGDTQVGLFVGRPTYEKGFDILLDVIRSMPECTFMIVANGDLVAPNTKVFRRVPHRDMPMVYSAADFLILPSRYEGFNLTILEALACRVPVVISRAACPFEGDVAEYGTLVDSQSPTDYVDAVRALGSRKESRNPRNRIRERYSLQRFAEEWRTEVSRLIR